MALVFFFSGVGEKTHVVVHVEVEQGAGFAAGFVDYEVVKCVVLVMVFKFGLIGEMWGKTYMWDYKIFLWVEAWTLASNGRRGMIEIGLFTLTYMRLSTFVPRSSGNCCRHFSKNMLISSPFLH